ncbi:MAG: 2-dehydropantoate 2-reductase [Actinobacteria bacterium]|nr:2-dehydropantoate 2-reductase [Actinomycetota bacterium]
MRFLIAGTGGVGGYYGARLLEGGHDVWFLARGANLEGLRGHGLELQSDFGDARFESVRAIEDGAEAGEMDVVLFCVKTYDNASAAEAIGRAVASGTAIVSLQNGVENEAFLIDRFPLAEVLAGVSRIEAWVERPGVIVQRGPQTNINLGVPQGGPSERAEVIAEAFARGGVPAEASENMPLMLWTKLMGICGFGGVSAYCRCTLGEILADVRLRDLIVGCWTECSLVARAHGIPLPEDAASAMLQYGETVLRPEFKSSMCRDVEREKPLEVDAINGAVVRFGAEAGVDTPANQRVLETLLPLHHAALAARTG